MNAEGYIRLTLEVEREDDQYVSRCVELDVVSCGDTVDEALENIRDAITVYLETLDDLGERERTFREKGIRVHRQRESAGATRKVPLREKVVTMTETVAV